MKKISNKNIRNNLKLGNKEFKTFYFLSPLAGYTNLAFRYMLETANLRLSVTEMINTKALCYNDQKTISMLDTSIEKEDVGVQIFGSNLDFIKNAVIILNDLNRFSHIDINMGCPAPKIVKNHEGSYLMTEPKLASKIVETAKLNSKIPVTVKIRKGFDKNNVNAVEFAKIMESSGADMITVHGRLREDYYSGKNDIEIIKKVKENVKIPVIGNGDVVDIESFLKILKYTNCDGVAIGRGALYNPFIFREIDEFLENGFNSLKTENEFIVDKLNFALTHYKIAIKLYGDVAVREMRKHLNYYLKGIKNSCTLRNDLNTETDYKKVICILERFKEDFIQVNL